MTDVRESQVQSIEARWEREPWSYKTLYRGHGHPDAERVFYWTVAQRGAGRSITVLVIQWKSDRQYTATLQGRPNLGISTVIGRRRFATTTDALDAVERYLNDKHASEGRR